MKEKTKTCVICNQTHQSSHGTILKNLEPRIQSSIKKENPNLTDDDFICFDDILNFRLSLIEQQSKKDALKISAIDQKILKSIKNHDFISKEPNNIDKELTLGQRVADGIAKFGGSWTFIFIFIFIIVTWITINAVALFSNSFDPYPFILLNLVLSCLAAIQAPIIMMSQNRQEERDHIQSSNDYEVNLKAEIEVRLLHEKVDHLLFDQMQRMQELQDIQIAMLEELKSDIKEVKDAQ